MGVRGLCIIGFFAIASLVAIVDPFWGVAAYVAHYHSFPERSWWGAALATLGVRYSLIISLFLVIGTFLNLGKIPSKRWITRQETLYLFFLGWMVLVRQFSEQLTPEDVVDKMLKTAVFVFALTHVIVSQRQFDRFLWLVVSCGLYLGFECFTAPASHFNKGRLEGVGGPDFSDANAMAAHLVALLPFIGIQFLRGGWIGKPVCFLAGGLVANSVVQTRSRGAYLSALAGLIAAILFVPRSQRNRFYPLVVLGLIGSLFVVDAKFIERMGSLKSEEREKDESAQGRLRFWRAGLRMALDNPFGVGPGNFHAKIGTYLPDDAGRDTHNAYVRCVAELGWPGLGLLVLLILNGFQTLARIRRSASTMSRPGGEDIALQAFSVQISMLTYTISSIFISSIYIEFLWWILLLPCALDRVEASLSSSDSNAPPAIS